MKVSAQSMILEVDPKLSNDEMKSCEENTEKNECFLVCSHCNLRFTTRSSLSRHTNHRCQQKDKINNKSKDEEQHKDDLVNEIKKRCDQLERQCDQLENDKKYLKTIIEINQNDNKYLKTIIDKDREITHEAVKCSSNALNFITQNYPTAPILQPMPNYAAIKNDCGSRDFAVVICEFYEDEKLIKYLSQFLLHYYKKTDPQEQSLWNSDCSRLNYIIRTIVENKPSWITDKKGLHFKENVITPLISHIKNEVFDYLTNSKSTKTIDIIHSSSRLIQDIDNSVISDELVRHLAPYFHYKALIKSN
jgi:hypothetical protein